MNPAQEKFREFVLELVEQDRQGKASDMLEEVFEKQKKQTLSKNYLLGLLPKLMPMLKPEYRRQAEALIMQYATGGFKGEGANPSSVN